MMDTKVEDSSVTSSRSSARRRWQLVRQVLTNGDKSDHLYGNRDLEVKDIAGEPEACCGEQSAIRYPSYGLITMRKIGDCDSVSKDDHWYRVTSDDLPLLDLKIGLLKPVFTKSTLRGFNNTGNVCIWPAEECLATVCVEKRFLVEDKDVIELGCGMTGLAGLIIAQLCNPRSVLLTDGNSVSVANVRNILRVNGLNQHRVKAGELMWDKTDALEARFDTVLCADCIFFEEYRRDLRNCIWKLLRADGRALMTAPSRGDSLKQFLRICQDVFEVSVFQDYSERISSRKSELENDTRFYEDKDYPLLLDLRKKPQKEQPIMSNL